MRRRISGPGFSTSERTQGPRERETHEARLLVTTARPPLEPILRPREIEDERFADQLAQEATFGLHRVLDRSQLVAPNHPTTRASTSRDPLCRVIFGALAGILVSAPGFCAAALLLVRCPSATMTPLGGEPD